jgi:hypothetical protein
LQITITGFNIAGDGVPNAGDGTDQDFALACYNCAEFPDFTLTATPATQEVCAPADAVYTLEVGQILGYTDPVTLSALGAPSGTTVGFSPNPVVPPGGSTLTIGNTGAAAVGSYDVDVIGVAPTSTHTTTVGLDIFGAPSGAVTLSSPADGAVNVDLSPTLAWSTASQAGEYLVEVATDPGFANIVYSALVDSPSHTLAVSLESRTEYHWRVRSGNACGEGPYSSTSSFTTVVLPGDCPIGTVPFSPFSEDFESGAVGWVSSGTTITDTWSLSGARVHGGSWAYHAQDVSNVSEQQLTSPVISLPAGESPLTLSFWNWQEIEDRTGGCYDGGLLDVSVDGGPWTQVTSGLLTDPYDGPLSSIFGNPRGGDDAWCGDPQDWLKSVVDLDALAGSDVQFRFVMATDSSVNREGWYLDDVNVQSCLATPSGTLSGAVTSENTGLGVNGAAILADNGSQQFSTTSGGGGNYSIFLPTGTYNLTASASGYLTTTVSGVVITTDTTTVQDIALPAGLLERDPALVEVTVGLGNVTARTMTLTNSGGMPLTFSLSDMQTAFTPSGITSIQNNESEARPSPGGGDGDPNRLGPTATTQSTEGLEATQDNVIVDGGFETGTPNSFWYEFSTNFGTPICDVASCGTGTGTGPHNGAFWAWFGGITVYEEGRLSQDVTLPFGSASLSFYLEQIVCADPADYLEVLVDSTQVYITDGSSSLCGTPGYELQMVDLSAFADGGVHSIEFHSEVFGSGTTNFFVDDVAVDVQPDAIWVSESPMMGTIPAGGTLTIDILFDGNAVSDTGTYTATLDFSGDYENLLSPATLVMHLLPEGISNRIFLPTIR